MTEVRAVMQAMGRATNILRKTLSIIAKVWVYLPVVVMALAALAIAIQLLSLVSIAYSLLVSLVLIVGIALVGLYTTLSEKVPLKGSAALDLERITIGPEARLPLIGEFASVHERQIGLVLEYVKHTGVSDVSQGVKINGTRASHEVDLAMAIGGKIYIGEIKPRLLVPSDIESAALIRSDIADERPDISGVILFTSTSPTSDVLELATHRNVDIEILPQLQTIGYYPMRR
jgi:hypothetical protein